MGKNNKKRPPPLDESFLIIPTHPAVASSSTTAPIVDTHTHLISTFSAYREKYPTGKFQDVFEFVRSIYAHPSGSQDGPTAVEAIVDVYCEAPINKAWRELADSAVSQEDRTNKWGGMEYWFVMGVHPHEARHYTDEVELELLTAMTHPRNVGWGEIGLDYHYDLSPREVQQEVFVRQLRHAIRLGKPLTIHTREAEEDTERILKQEVPKDHRIHIHCFTDSPEFAQRLLDHFPNLYIGITGVITYSTNLNTSAVIRNLVSSPSPRQRQPLRIVLETDAPYMVPGNIYKSLPSLSALKSGTRLPLCHTGMLPWTAEFVAGIVNETAKGAIDGGAAVGDGVDQVDVPTILREARENATKMYGV